MTWCVEGGQAEEGRAAGAVGAWRPVPAGSETGAVEAGQ